MSSLREEITALCMSPWSMWLKQFLRNPVEGDDAGRVLRLEVQPANRASRSTLAAWSFWLLGGDVTCSTADEREVSFLAGNGHTLIFGRDSNGEDSAGLYGELSLFAGLRLLLTVTIAPGTAGCIRRFFASGELPLVFPEGDGCYYRDLECVENGFSRILPDEVIDQALDFSDSVRDRLT